MSSSEESSPAPARKLCIKACGYYGDTATKNMCSRCFIDGLKLACNRSEQASQQSTSIATTNTNTNTNTNSNSNTNTNSNSNSNPNPNPNARAEGNIREETGSSTVDLPDDKTKSRCGCCNKKVGLLKGFKCRCGGTFCSIHRYAEEHSCTFDYKATAEADLIKNNPILRAEKLERM